MPPARREVSPLWCGVFAIYEERIVSIIFFGKEEQVCAAKWREVEGECEEMVCTAHVPCVHHMRSEGHVVWRRARSQD